MKYVVGAKTTDEVDEVEKQNRQIAFEAAVEGIVLLKNEKALPLKENKIALFGAGAEMTIKGGTGSGEVNNRNNVSILQGLQNYGFEIDSLKWINDFSKEYQEKIQEYKEQFKKVSVFKLASVVQALSTPIFPCGRLINNDDIIDINCQTAIYVIARQAGEGSDKKIEKGDYDFQENEIKNLEFLSNKFKKVILVINSGSSMNLSLLDKVRIDGVIYYCQQGEEGGNALASLLCGKRSFSGKLTDTWALKYDDIPFANEYSYLSGDVTKEYYKEGIYVGYRYFDTFNVKPRFPFGYGLTYSKFDISLVNASLNNNNVELNVEVSNAGDYKGKEVVQVYVSSPNGKIKKEYQRLVAFKKSKELDNNEKQVLALSFPISYCSSYDEVNAQYILEKGKYIVRIGNNSLNTTPMVILNLAKDVIVSQNKNICKLDEKIEELPGKDRVFEDKLDNAVNLDIDADSIKTEEIIYKEAKRYHDDKVDEIMNKLSVNDLIDVVVGTGIPGMLSCKKIACPGTVGRTTDKLYKKGLINVNLSDGPAGIRILRKSAIRNGKLKFVDYLMECMSYYPKWLLKIITANEKKDQVLYQYCTAFPVETAIAQSFNEELTYKIGEAISREMNKYNITYWLAPAMNIHRNPLCGRNFEYFSEDPILTAKMAIALTRGVEDTKGNYVTIKHFACNNQEDNRNQSNSIVNERALREIYLKGFEITVKESHPRSVMTSYNLLNGVYTNNSYDLINEALRNEWGFNGVVMTDWYATGIDGDSKAQLGVDEKAIAVGNDLIMPGSKNAKKNLKKAIKNKTLSVEQLQKAAANIIRSILESRVATLFNPNDFQ